MEKSNSIDKRTMGTEPATTITTTMVESFSSKDTAKDKYTHTIHDIFKPIPQHTKDKSLLERV